MKWVLIDFSYLCHRALYSTGGLEFEDIPTGVVFGFWEQLMEICTNPAILSNKILLFGDSRKSYRRKIFPDYKRKRYENRTEEEKEKLGVMYHQANFMRMEIFPAVGIPFYRQSGLESDDLIALAAKQLTKKKEPAVIITSDGDLYQCITKYVSWFDPQRGKYVTPSDLKRDKGVGPELWAEVKAIGGCSSDNVPGIKGVSEKGAIAFLKGELPSHYKKYSSITSKEGKKTLQLMRQLVTLPHEGTKSFVVREPEYNEEAFFHYAKKFGIDSYMEGKRKNRWRRFFKGQMIPGAMPRMRRRKNGRKK